MAVSPSSLSGTNPSLLNVIELLIAPVPPANEIFVAELVRGELGSCLNLPNPNKLLKLLLPAVDVELRPLPPPTNGGVGGESSEFSLCDPTVDDRCLVGLPGGASAGEDLAE